MTEVQDRHRREAEARWSGKLSTLCNLDQLGAYAQCLADKEAETVEWRQEALRHLAQMLDIASERVMIPQRKAAEDFLDAARANADAPALPGGYTVDHQRRMIFGPDGDSVAWIDDAGRALHFNTLNLDGGLPRPVVLAALRLQITEIPDPREVQVEEVRQVPGRGTILVVAPGDYRAGDRVIHDGTHYRVDDIERFPRNPHANVGLVVREEEEGS